MQFAPGPVLIHSFDSGGLRCIEDDQISSGRIIPITEFEGDTVVAPFAYRAWEKEFYRLSNGGLFDAIGTYVIDSFTSFAQSLMNEILKARSRKPPMIAQLGKDPDIVPELGDYNVHQKTLAHNLAQIMSIPCNVVVIAHLNIDKDDTTGRLYSSVMMDGKKFAQTVPTLFDEVYFADTKGVPPNLQYVYRLVPKSYYPARSRLRKSGKILGAEEVQNLARILEKSGYPFEDKDLYTT